MSMMGYELAEKLYSEQENDLYNEIYERAFSDGYEYAQAEFSKKGKKIDLEDIESHRGLGRSYFVGGLGGALGGYAGKKYADELDANDKEGKYKTKEGKDKLVRKVSERGAQVGAGAGAALGVGATLAANSMLPKGYHFAKGNPVGSGLLLAGLGAAGGYLGAKKNAKTRLKKRDLAEKGIYDD